MRHEAWTEDVLAEQYKMDKGKKIDRYYYIDIEEVLGPIAENEDVIISVPDIIDEAVDETIDEILSVDNLPLSNNLNS